MLEVDDATCGNGEAITYGSTDRLLVGGVAGDIGLATAVGE